ncbi:cingulin-like protein 1 [Seriola lalandi dorsalis]|uniref:cingulin-like protein 1 n=1 Tax=Seriola lalandi dorsalis TaxID=1841481 RepID=UPI000C6FB5A2|nr:cingulin-like protein 1 [Seriola lalandi dorsalis]
MDSYRVTGIPNSGPQRVYTQPSRSSRPHSNGAGTYGLSIRVQGIDGHPYVVLNNQDRGLQSYSDPNSNGYVDAEGSFIENYQEYDFRGGKEAGSTSPFMEYRSQKMMHYTGPQNGGTDSQGKKPSTLLNFQKHPEILQPYDPETNSLNLEGIHSQPSRPLFPAEIGNEQQSSTSKSAVPAPSRASSSSLDRNRATVQQEKRQLPSESLSETALPKPKSQPQSVPLPQLTQTRPQSQTAQPQSRPRLANLNPPQSKQASKTHQQSKPPAQPQTSAVSSPTSEQSKTSCRSPSSMSSANSSLERARREPDVLPLRRTDSSGPVLQSSSRSRHSSSSSTSKAQVDEQMEALYADTINRHENRRYIPFLPGSGRDIDTGSIPGVDELIEKFDGKDGSHQRRGRAGRRNRINPEDRKRSRSVDSALGLRDGSSYMDEFSRHRGTSMEHVLRPSQLRLQKTASSQDSRLMTADGKVDIRPSSRVTSAPGSPQSTISKGVGSIQGYKKPQTRSSSLPFKSKENEDSASSAGKISTTSVSTSLSKLSSGPDKKPSTEADVQATPDLLKGQQELSQQTHEETAKQILFSYLKDGSNDTDETTKRKVNLVFEKIQTLKSRATASAQGDNKSLDLAAQTKALQEQNVELEKEMAELKRQLEQLTMKNQADKKTAAGLKELQQELEQSTEECKRLKEKLAKTEAELQTTVEELFQVKMEREQYQTEIRDLQDQLSEMHDELDSAKKSAADGEKDIIIADMMQLKVEMQEVLLAKEEQEEVLRRRERELTALKGALKEEVAAHDQEVDKMKEQYEKEISRLQTSLEDAKQVISLSFLSRREEDLRQCQRERDEAELRERMLEKKVNELEMEADTNAHTKEDKSRHIKLLEDRIAQLELNLDEERHSGDQLMDRIDRGREQVEQMRNELLQERASRQDLECDKMALERQNKDLKGRVSHLEGSQKSNKEGLVAQLEDRIQELEERLEGEEREHANLQLVNRRLERKVKEVMMQVEEEHHSLQDQKDQLNLRLKALKRQMDEAEEEIDRLEHSKKKLQRDLDEQQEANEQLQSQLKSMRSEMRRKNTSAPLLNNLDDDDDDDISTDGETYFSSSSGYKRSSSQDNILSTFTL